MTPQIHVNVGGGWEAPELQISGSAKALVELGMLLNQARPQLLILPIADSEFFPVAIGQLIIDPGNFGGARLSVDLTKDRLRFAGDRVAMNKLGDSLINFFDEEAEVGDHFQLDYFEGNDILNETPCTLIFIRTE